LRKGYRMRPKDRKKVRRNKQRNGRMLGCVEEEPEHIRLSAKKTEIKVYDGVCFHIVA